jgi:hypothetical protein
VTVEKTAQMKALEIKAYRCKLKEEEEYEQKIAQVGR